ncbi:MAG: hypothetical protein P4L99_27965 [Chthoniobacter sp.]|nr:hypothetical protein [Chthoniobacter sp.]
MKFFVSAIGVQRDDLLAREINAEDFDDAVHTVRLLMIEEFGCGSGRITSVTETPEIGARFPMTFYAAGAVAGQHLKRKDRA